MKYLLAICFVLGISITHLSAKEKPFYLSYYYAGLGSNYWLALHDSSWEVEFYPQIEIKGQVLKYKIERKTGKYQINDRKDTSWSIDTISYQVKFRSSSIDSIKLLLGEFKDTTIFECNQCIMSGAIHYLNIAKGTDTIRYELMNTFDTTALKIAEIVNNYLPADNRIWATRDMIKASNDCLEYFRHQMDEDDEKRNKK